MLAFPQTCAVRAKLLSCVKLYATLWTVAHQALLPMGSLQARMREWVAMPPQSIFPTHGSHLDLLCLLHWQAGFLFFNTRVTWEAPFLYIEDR